MRNWNEISHLLIWGILGSEGAGVPSAAPAYLRGSNRYGLTKSMGEIPEWSANGRGQSFGSVIHKGLEEVGKGLAMSELPAYVQYLCQVEGVAEKDAGDALPILQEVLDSELWQRSQRAKQRLFEIPIMMHQRNGDQRHFTQPNRQYPKQPPRH